MKEFDFDKGNGLVPVIIQDDKTAKVLMLGYFNAEAYKKTVESGKVTFYSRSKQRLWTKGETSSNFLNVVQIMQDCDNDTLLVKVDPDGPVCHTGTDTCFSEVNRAQSFLHQLEEIITDRKNNPKEGSYTNHLFDKGINKIAQKVGEEAVELVIESKDENQDLFLGEAADLMYHYIVLLAQKGFTLNDVEQVLQKRHS
ncbi:MAG: bifunctional phosphoribosyl-AMP cyclohydrolase/phosphoribosyl-ATP diphosphatase HisIE [Bacteroidia bacterium]|nr:bifunctional phosphoribosyl-AMP cyclohydrolase/phosphoribosyl-ATP diphosphatase HisIE [Bacteroidia bacterium]